MRGSQTEAPKPIFHEPGRTYTSSVVLLALLSVGFFLDVALGGGVAHLVGWVIAVVAVVGIDMLAVHAARTLRSITVTEDLLSVGEASVERERIIGFERNVDPSAPVIGRALGEGMPRGARGLALHLSDGGVVVVPTRQPERLAQLLEVELRMPDIRPAEPGDDQAVREVQDRAATLFQVAGIDLPGNWLSIAEMHDALVVLVSGDPIDGFVRVGEADGMAVIELLGVVPGSMRRGVGSSLVEAACSWAAGHGYPAIAVMTYADIAWNAPFFAARGFVPTSEVGPELAELRDWEHAIGLDAVGRRVIMRRPL